MGEQTFKKWQIVPKTAPYVKTGSLPAFECSSNTRVRNLYCYTDITADRQTKLVEKKYWIKGFTTISQYWKSKRCCKIALVKGLIKGLQTDTANCKKKTAPLYVGN